MMYRHWIKGNRRKKHGGIGRVSGVDKITQVIGVGWFSHMLIRKYGNILKKALRFEVDGCCQKTGKPKRK